MTAMMDLESLTLVDAKGTALSRMYSKPISVTKQSHKPAMSDQNVINLIVPWATFRRARELTPTIDLNKQNVNEWQGRLRKALTRSKMPSLLVLNYQSLQPSEE